MKSSKTQGCNLPSLVAILCIGGPGAKGGTLGYTSSKTRQPGQTPGTEQLLRFSVTKLISLVAPLGPYIPEPVAGAGPLAA